MAQKQTTEKPVYSGYFLTFEPRRTSKILESLHYYGEASEAFSAMDWAFERREIALISLSPGKANIDAVVLMDRMHGSGGTGKLKMRMWSPVMIEEPIKPKDIANAFPASERLCTAETFRRIPHDEWQPVLESIKRLRPDLAARLDALIEMRDARIRLTGDDARVLRLTEQRDALGLTLDIASLDRKSILRGAHLSQVDAGCCCRLNSHH